MSSSFLVILLVLVGVAALVQGDFILRATYLMAGAIVVGRWWSGRVLRSLAVQRYFPQRAFLGEDITVRLEIRNTGSLPAPWVHLYDSLPVELAAQNLVNRVIHLGPRGRAELAYVLHARKRGCYKIGPLFISNGDLLGLGAEERREGPTEFLTVYPHIISFSRLALPSSSPQGTLRHVQPIFEDPTRVLGKRDYVVGDSLRRVDWKSSAAAGRLQVKQFEPSMALETCIFLNLNRLEYPSQACIDATELGIVVAASLANWIAGQKQTVGLAVNGVDPFTPAQPPQPIPPRKGRSHLMRILDLLARIQIGETNRLVDLIRMASPSLSWGTTLILITGNVDEALFDECFQVRRRGLNVVLILAGRIPELQSTRQRAERFGIPLYAFQTETDLDIWRQ